MNPVRIEFINLIDLILVPRINNPNSFKQFRPIALCNFIYKFISKIIDNWLKTQLDHLISPNQSSFVLGWHITNNVIVV